MDRPYRAVGCRLHAFHTPRLRAVTASKRWAYALAFLVTCCVAQGQNDAKVKQLLQASISALGDAHLTRIVINGSVGLPPVSSQSPVKATMRAEASGSVRTTYHTTPTSQEEARIVGGSPLRSGNWRDSKGILRPLASHNLMIEPAWFFPFFGIQRSVSGTDSGLQATYVGQETFHGVATHHLRIARVAEDQPLLQRLSQYDLYLDIATLLPAAYVFNDHPDRDALVDIPVTVLYSNYARLSGILLPLHVQQFRNNALFIDLQVHDLEINTNEPIALLQ